MDKGMGKEEKGGYGIGEGTLRNRRRHLTEYEKGSYALGNVNRGNGEMGLGGGGGQIWRGEGKLRKGVYGFTPWCMPPYASGYMR